MTGDPGKEHGTNKLPPTGRVQERSKGETTCLTTSQNPSLWHPSWLNKACTTGKDSESEWLAKDNLETNFNIIKPKTASHMTELFSWVPLPYCSPLGCPFPIKSLVLSDPDSGKDWGQEEKGMTEDEMVAWHHWLNGHEFDQNLEDSEKQESLACCSPWGHKASGMT